MKNNQPNTMGTELDEVVEVDDMRVKTCSGQGRKPQSTEVSNSILVICIILGILGLISMAFDKCSKPDRPRYETTKLAY